MNWIDWAITNWIGWPMSFTAAAMSLIVTCTFGLFLLTQWQKRREREDLARRRLQAEFAEGRLTGEDCAPRPAAPDDRGPARVRVAADDLGETIPASANGVGAAPAATGPRDESDPCIDEALGLPSAPSVARRVSPRNGRSESSAPQVVPPAPEAIRAHPPARRARPIRPEPAAVDHAAANRGRGGASSVLAVMEAEPDASPPAEEVASPVESSPVDSPLRVEAPLIVVRRVSKTYPTPTMPVHALRDVSLEIGSGVTAIVGPNGSGKSTLMKILGGLDRPTSGEVRYRGRSLPFDRPAALRRFLAHEVSWVMQDLNLFQTLSAEENVAFILRKHGVPRQEALAVAREQLTALGLAERHFRSLPHQLSGGERQRVAVARCFTGPARLILADEPTAACDPESGDDIMRRFLDTSHERGLPVVLVTHNPKLAERADRIVHMNRGGIAEMVTCGAAADPVPPRDRGRRAPR